jgi:hypothetical protein
MENISKPSLPIYENWIAFNKGMPCQGILEYELLSDATIIGSTEENAFGPFQFINLVPPREHKVRPVFILRVDTRLLYDYGSLPDKTDTSLYHGGILIDEIAAVMSLTMGIRVKAGDLTREFRSSDDRFGNPIGWHAQPIPDIVPELAGRYKLPVVLQESRIGALEPFKSLPGMSHNDVVPLIKSARLYQQALWIAESEPSLAWIMFVSALETAAHHHWQQTSDTPRDRLQFGHENLFNYLESCSIPGLTDRVAAQIEGYLGSTKKFVEFVVKFLPSPPALRPLKPFQISWENTDLRKMLRTVYDHRSRALHGGTPFPLPMCEAPYRSQEFLALLLVRAEVYG